ncbi:DEAD/DEAH box helicase family protein [Streptomyces pristinaespiralis]|uniref:DEAD/DEAH box helicase family protein n=1 Tax=Streptomyces pristinaespiralis TaxID=38300 RepID=UPI00384C1032
MGFLQGPLRPRKGRAPRWCPPRGSGKTITAAWAALECFRGGRILVMVPTLDLLVQTVQAWRRVGHNGPMVAVCSLEKDDVLEHLGVRTTTNAIQLALWAGHGPVVVFATYASLVDRDDPEDPLGQRKVRGPLEAALAGGERLYGQRMAPFDLAVVDEAHSTAGDLGRPWAAIHDNTRIPADFRLYLTATPRILASPLAAEGQGRPRAGDRDHGVRPGRPVRRVDLRTRVVRGDRTRHPRRFRDRRAGDPRPLPRPRGVGGGAAGPAPRPAADGAPGARRRAEPAHGHDFPPAGGGSDGVRGEDAADGRRIVRGRGLRRGPGRRGGPAEVIDRRGVLRAGVRPPRTPGEGVVGMAVRRPPRRRTPRSATAIR